MFRYIYYNPKNFTKDVELAGNLPADWINVTDSDCISSSTWEEHCLECAVPQCYGTCSKYIKRRDGRCQKTYYGLKQRKDVIGFTNAVQLKFRPWGKIESIEFGKSISVHKYHQLDVLFKTGDTFLKGVSGALRFIPNSYRLCDWNETMKHIIVERLGEDHLFKSFLFQCYSPEKTEYQLFIEIFDGSGPVFYRNAMTIKPGYNQHLLDMREVDFQSHKKRTIRIYPENDKEVEIVILFSDLVDVEVKSPKDTKVISKEPAKKVKCVAWDLDNTIWQGVLIESDPESLCLREHVLDTIKQLDERGIIQVVVSKNDEIEVLPVLKRLGIYDYFVYVVANWDRKSSNLQSLADTININIDTFALIDDSTFERGEVHETLPCVRVYDENSFPEFLGKPEFDVVVTEDSKNRRKMYQIEAGRNNLKKSFTGSDIDFFKSCELTIEIKEIGEDSMLRSYELLQRTNQLNLSGHRYEMDEFRQLVEENKGRSFTVFCHDKFGDYGQVGFFIVSSERGDEDTTISEYVMSCRVAEKWIEPALLNWLKNKFVGKRIVFNGVYNRKNDRLIITLKKYDLVNKTDDENKIFLCISCSDVNYPEVVTVKDLTCEW